MSARAEEYASEFLFAWLNHFAAEAVATGDPADVALPDDWEASLTRFYTAGLPAAAVQDAITITMDRKDVAEASLFRYFCGVGWRMLRERHGEQPRQPSAGPQAADGLPVLPRTTVQQVACPKCGAPPGGNCIGSRGKPRESNHRERVAAAVEASVAVGD